MIIELHFNSINSKNYKQINQKIYDIFESAWNYESQTKLEELDNENIRFSFLDINYSIYIDYNYSNKQASIDTAWNEDFVIDIIEILLPELFWEYKIDCNFFIRSEKGIEHFEDFFKKRDKYIVEKVYNWIGIFYELEKKINNEEIEKTFKLYELKKILKKFSFAVQKNFSWLDFIGFLFGLVWLVALFFTANFKDIFWIKNSWYYFKLFLLFIIGIWLLILFKYPFIRLRDYFYRVILKQEIPFWDYEKEAERIYWIKKK